MDQNKIGNFIAENRKKEGLTQGELAKELGVSNRTVSNWENGKCMPDYDLLIPLTKKLNISISELINGEKNGNIIDDDKKRIMKVIDFLKYIEEEKNKNYKKIGKVIFYFGILIVLLILLFIPSNVYNSSIYIFSGLLISFVGLLYLIHRENCLKIILFSFLFLISSCSFLLFQDYVNVLYFKSPPRYQTELYRKIFTGHVYFETILYDVYACEDDMFSSDIGKNYVIVKKDKNKSSYEKILEYCELEH